MSLVHLRLLIYIPVRFILLTKIQISLNRFLSLLQFFGYDKPWSQYLTNRNLDTSFKLATFSIRYFRKSDKILDLGCGIGQLLPYISSKCRSKNIYGMDKSFLNLLIARRFFADNASTLICGDVEKGLPFKGNFLSAILAVDSFHYIKQKYFFLKEITHTLSKNGLLFIIHTINGLGTVYGNINAVSPKLVFGMLKKLKFKKIYVFPDSDIAYTVFASKGNFFKNVWI
jgi:SAM-dependent methyltransferase